MINIISSINWEKFYKKKWYYGGYNSLDAISVIFA